MLWHAIAPGHDDPLNVKPFHLLSPPLFRDYPHGFIHTWADYEAREMTGDRRHKAVGLPSMSITFPVITNPERLYLQDTFCAGGDDAPITLYALNKRTTRWTYYNALLVLPVLADLSDGWDYCEWRNYKVDFFDLTEINIELFYP